MNPTASLSDREREAAQNREFEEQRAEPLNVLDAMNLSHSWHRYYQQRDALALLEEMDRLLWFTLSNSGKMESAELEEQRIKSIENGG